MYQKLELYPVLDLSNFSWGRDRIEAPKAPMGVGCGEVVGRGVGRRCPLPTGGRVWGGAVPSPENFFSF